MSQSPFFYSENGGRSETYSDINEIGKNHIGLEDGPKK